MLAKPVDLPRLLGLGDEALGQPLVMVVDDDPDPCATLWDLLRDRGSRACLAHDALVAGQWARERDYRVVLIDTRLPDGDRAGVSHAVREATVLEWCE